LRLCLILNNDFLTLTILQDLFSFPCSVYFLFVIF
jgi:hypothetical protein